MKVSTKRLHETLIRLLKGCLKAWETWLREQPLETSESTTQTESGGN